MRKRNREAVNKWKLNYVWSWAYEQTFFPSAQKIFPLSNPNHFPFEPKKTKIREDIFSEIKERKESSSIFVVWEWIYNVKFNMNAKTWDALLLLIDPLKVYLRGSWNQKKIIKKWFYDVSLREGLKKIV